MKRLLGVFLSLVLLLSGCAATGKEHTKSPTPIFHTQETNGATFETTRGAKITAENDARVDAAATVAIGTDLSVALKVSNFNRLHLKSIRQNIHHELKNQFPGYTIHVTTDRKLFQDLQELQRKLGQKNTTDTKQMKKYIKKLRKINEEMKG